MIAGDYNLIIDIGATLEFPITWKSGGAVVNVTGYSARMQIREQMDSASPLISLISPGDITIGGVDGLITVKISAAATAAITADKGVFDLELIAPNGNVRRLLQGVVIFRKNVTR